MVVIGTHANWKMQSKVVGQFFVYGLNSLPEICEKPSMRSITRWPASRGQSAGFCLTIVDIKKNEHKNMVTQISLEGWWIENAPLSLYFGLPYL